MPDPEPAPPRRPFPVFHVAATFAGTLCVVTLGVVALGLSLNVPAFRADAAGATSDGPTCPASNDTRSAAELQRVEDCERSRHVERLLVDAGAHGADATVETVSFEAADGPPEHVFVFVQLHDGGVLRMRPAELSGTIARAVGTKHQYVLVVDDQLRTIRQRDGIRHAHGASQVPKPARSVNVTESDTHTEQADPQSARHDGARPTEAGP